MAVIKFHDVVTPTDWTAEQQAFVRNLLAARDHNPTYRQTLTLNLIGRMVAKTPGQMNRFNTEAGFAIPYGPRKKKRAKHKPSRKSKTKIRRK
ncbi:MAG TPA: hypothetical protein VHP58_05650 [Alphaproteobacteria bacterium]|nr:hypothetical protein [Alphaproteobacteria bacterium]